MKQPPLPNLDEDEDALSCDILPITGSAQLELAAGALIHFAVHMDNQHARNLILEIIMKVDLYGENIRKIKRALPLALCQITDEIDVNFAINYVIYERQYYQENSNYMVFTRKFFDDQLQGSDYGTLAQPVCLPSISFTYNYLDNLVRVKEGKLAYERIGNKSVEDIILDTYQVKNVITNEVAEVVVNPYAELYCTAIPQLPF